MDETSSGVKHRFPVLGELQEGTVQHHSVELPGSALTGTRWPVTTISGAAPGPVVLVTAGVHGAEYPSIECAIRLGKQTKPENLRGTLVILPVVNLPAFWERSMFVCPVDNQNPNRMFPGDPDGTYSEQLAHAITSELIARADYYIDLHGGDMVEALEPFSICRGGETQVDRTSEEMARAFGLENLLIIDRPVQEAKGDMTFVAAAQRGVPGFIAEAGGVGQLDEPSVKLLFDGVVRVLNHLEMADIDVEPAPSPRVFHGFQWIYSESEGMFYTGVSVGDRVSAGQSVGRVGSLFGEEIEQIESPVDGRVLFLTTSPAVKREGLLMGIGIET